jgi:hypothetical protein
MKIKKKYQRILRDIALLLISIALSVWFARSGLAEHWVAALPSDYSIFASFVSGFFFTSIFTLAPASIALGAIGEFHPHGWVALWGAMGAVIGDLLLFVFVRDEISGDVAALLSGRCWRWLRQMFRRPFFHWLLPIGGALVIASPLPDELGLAMMGLSRISLASFIPISYAMNFLGILLIEFLAGKAF